MEKNISFVTLAVKTISQNLTCAVCLDKYTSPKVLPCQHSFCLSCIQGLPFNSGDEDGTHRSISCPLCRNECELPDTGAEGLPTHFQINQLVELEQKLETRKEPPQEMCVRHSEPVKLYCETCNELICLECALSTCHSSHKYKRIEEVYDSHKIEIQERLLALREKITQFDGVIENLSIIENELHQNTTDIKNKIIAHTAEVINEITKHQNQLLAEADSILYRKLQCTTAQKNKAKEMGTQLKAFEEMIAQSLKEWSESKLVRDKSSVMKGLNTMIDMQSCEVFQPIEQPNITFAASPLPVFSGELHYSLFTKQIIILQEYYMEDVSATAQLVLKTNKNKPFCVSPSMIRATVNSPLNKKHEIECCMTQKYDGTYQVSFTPTARGEHLLSISVGGINIKGSPFVITVRAKTDSIGLTVNSTYGLKHPWGVGVFNDGRVVVAENGSNSVVILDENGRHIERIVIQNKVNYPRAVAVADDQQNIFVTGNHSITKASLEGECQATFSYFKPLGSLDYPGGVAVQPTTGNVFVADSRNNRVLVLDSQLKFQYILTKDNFLHRPSDIAFDKDGCIYISELATHCIRKLSPDGKEAVGIIGSRGRRPGHLTEPIAIAIHNQELYVCENGKNRVSVFDLLGNFLHFFEETDSGLLGIAVNHNGYIFISDYHNERVLLY